MNLLLDTPHKTINYTELKKRCIFQWANPLKLIVSDQQGSFKNTPFCHASVIIPAHGRTQFHKIITDNLLNAIKYGTSGQCISITIVEHSEKPEHQELLSPEINYIWIPLLPGERFNKSLAHNMGVLYGVPASNILFHDIDTVVPDDFFVKLKMNMYRHDAIQAFTGRRLLHANEVITEQVLQGKFSTRWFYPQHPHVTVAVAGAQGGSMYVTRDIFFKVGGFDDIYCTEYSVEDAFFYTKLQTIGRLGGADMPPIEMVHLHHPPSFDRRTKKGDMHAYQQFCDMSKQDKLAYMKIREEELGKHL